MTNLSSHLKLLTAVLSLCLTTLSQAAVFNWGNAAGGDFTTPGNWVGGVAPGDADHARLTNGTLITLSSPYTLSNLWVAARAINNATSRLEIASGGVLTLTGGPNSANNAVQVGVGTNALGRLELTGGTLDRFSFNPANSGVLLIGGGGGIGYFTVSSGLAMIDLLRVGSDNAGVGSGGTRGGFGFMDVNGGLVIVSNQCTIGRDLDVGTVTISGGEFVSLATNFHLGTDTDGFMTVAGGSSSGNSTGVVNVTTGGILRTYGGIRIAQSSATFIQDGTVRISGGRLTTQRLFQGSIAGTSLPKVEFDGGILEAVLATNSSGFIYGNINARVKAGGITIDSAGYDLPVVPGILADAGSPGGGITKSNTGNLRLMGTNTYTGPTVIQGGGVITTTASSGGGAVTVNDGSLFGVVVSYAGSSLNLSSLTLNGGSGTNGLNFDLRTFNNPTAPLITTPSLTVNRTNQISISGSPLTVGTFTLIQYTAGTGVTADHFEIASLPAGVTAAIVLEAGAVKLNILSAPSLHWNGNLSADWDTITPNWLDFSSVTPTATAYSDGSAVQFDDASATNFVNLVQAVAPALVTITNPTVNYTFGGVGSLVGDTGLRKLGAGMLTVTLSSNTYAGDTVITAGTLQLGISDVIPQGAGKGNVIINGTLDMNGFTDSVNGLTGAGIIDNSSFNAGTLTVGNNSSPGSFSGTITNSGSPLTFAKAGNQTLLLTGNNAHTGGTSLNGGVVQAANNNVLGFGPVDFNGGGLSSDGSSARTFTNSVVINADSTIGDLINTGHITLSGDLNFGATVRTWTARSDVHLTAGSIGSGWNKAGIGVVTLEGVNNWTGVMEVNQGTLIVNGSITNTDATRADCTFAGSFARMVLNPGSALVLTGPTTNIRVGNNGSVFSTNTMDIAGLAMTVGTGSADGRFVLGQGSTPCFANLLTNGTVIAREVEKVGTGNYCEINLDGGTLEAMTNNPTFMEGLSNVFVKAGGFTLNSASNDITIAQSLLNGGGNGGLTKVGAGTVFLNGNNTYTGTTTVNGGGLGGSGTLAGPVVVTGAGTFAPGSPVGTLTINNTLDLQGTTVMEVSRAGGIPSADLAIASTLTRGGSLTISQAGVNSLRSGDAFNLFDWSSASGAFTSVTVAPLSPGLFWQTNNLYVDGTVSIGGTATNTPHFNSPSISGTTLTMSGSGGYANGYYYVLMTTDLGLPLSSWTVLSTNQFDGSANFSFTDEVNIDPQRFYLISIP